MRGPSNGRNPPRRSHYFFLTSKLPNTPPRPVPMGVFLCYPFLSSSSSGPGFPSVGANHHLTAQLHLSPLDLAYPLLTRPTAPTCLHRLPNTSQSVSFKNISEALNMTLSFVTFIPRTPFLSPAPPPTTIYIHPILWREHAVSRRRSVAFQ